MSITIGFYDPGKIGYGMIHALMRDAPQDFHSIAYIKPAYRGSPPPDVFQTSTLRRVLNGAHFMRDDLNDFVAASDLIFLCCRARWGWSAVQDIMATPAWQNNTGKKIINVSKGLWKDVTGKVDLPSGHYPDLYQSGRLAMLSGLSFHTTLLHDYPVKMALSCRVSCEAEAAILSRSGLLDIETDTALRAAELYGITKNPLAIAAGYFDGEDTPVLLGSLACFESDRIARWFYPNPNISFSTCYARDDVWGSMTPLSRNFRYGRDLRHHGINAAAIYCQREGTDSLPEGAEGSANWMSYQKNTPNLPKTPLIDAVYTLCYTHGNHLETMRHAFACWAS